MGVLQRILGNRDDVGQEDAEQLADDDPAIRGESRNQGNYLLSTFDGTGFVSAGAQRFQSQRSGRTTTDYDDDDPEIEAVSIGPPTNIASDHEDYFFGPLSFPRSALTTFSLQVMEPGYHIGCTRNGETDEEMQEALREWASQAAIDGAESGEDLSVLLKKAPIQRYSKATSFIEKVPTKGDDDLIAGLVYHPPKTFNQYLQANKSLIIQPDDDVEDGHPMTPDGKPAAYVQYDTTLDYDDDDSVKFARDDLIKLTRDPDTGSPWGTTIWDSCGDRYDALVEKLQDRDASIRTVGHNHRIYELKDASLQKAEEYADAHKKGEVSAGPRVGDHQNDPEGYRNSWPGRVDFVPYGGVEPTTVEGNVADIADAVKDDIEAIFGALPVSKFKIGYAEDINQFVVEPQQATDDQLIAEERSYLERKFKPVIEEVADAIAPGKSYQGDVEFRIEPSEDENPLRRESFPRENLTAFAEGYQKMQNAGASPAVMNAYLSYAGFDLEQIQEEFGTEFSIEEFAPESQTPEGEESDEGEDGGQPDQPGEAVANGGQPANE